MRLLALLTILCAACSSVDPLSAGPEGVWLRGDLHLHSNHSNDALDNDMATIVARAESLGFDYFVVTDHDNHVDGALTTWDDPAYRSDTMTLLYGVEWTTGKGHANLFGPAPFDHPALYALRDGDGATFVAAAHAQGLHVSFNHPVGKDLWEAGFGIGEDGIEVWNAMFLIPNDNASAIALWDTRLLAGDHVTARGGSDCHHQTGAESRLFNMGNPTTWIFARDRSAPAILEALTAGHATVSYAPGAERLELRADADGDGRFESIVGDTIRATGRVEFRVEIVGHRPDAPYTLRVVKDGETLAMHTPSGPVLTFDDDVDGATFYRVELRGDVPEAPEAGAALFGDFIAMTNPIYVTAP